MVTYNCILSTELIMAFAYIMTELGPTRCTVTSLLLPVSVLG